MIPKKVACVGCGVIGSSWALLFARKNLEVVMYDTSEVALKNSLQTIRVMLNGLVKNGVVRKKQINEILARTRITTNLADIAGTDYVQESVIERLGTKIEVFRKLENFVSKDTILATSTSGLRLSRIQEHMKYPERAVIAHPFNPPHLIPLVEIVVGRKTGKSVVGTVRKFMISLDKEPIIVRKELPSFAVDRIQYAVFREALNLLNDDVVDLKDIEKIFYAGIGLRWAMMGPFTTFNLAGGAGGLKYYFEQFESDQRAALKSMRTWTSTPNSAREKAIKNVRELKEVRNENYLGLVRWRDEKLIKLLRLFGYL